MGMTKPHHLTFWLGALVVTHLIVSVVHGAAHAQAHVDLTPAAAVFVIAVIFAGPLVGLAVMWPAERLGGWLIAVTLTASLGFGVINHFILSSPDHVAHVAAGSRTLFAATAALSAVLEAAGAWMAWQVVRERGRS